ncbi:MAG: histidine phosphatase family protein [SAR324 cluster bacterium]|nr:histidine phosphatase family protein [SAR324 cluster bacterium]
MTRILIARHGNTFEKHETPTRVGRRTDISLVGSGRRQAEELGKFLKENYESIAAVFSSRLKRTIETAELALRSAQYGMAVQQMLIFDEIDYGPDEGKTEDEVVSRLGRKALQDWDRDAVVPSGWLLNPEEIIQNWRGFAEMVSDQYSGETVLVVTSNGIARFAPYLTGNMETFKQHYAIKISTGAVCSLVKSTPDWKAEYWNLKGQVKLV